MKRLASKKLLMYGTGGHQMINAIAITVSLIIGMLVGGIIGYCIAKDGEEE